MKFWYALNKNLTSQAGRFVYDNQNQTPQVAPQYQSDDLGSVDVNLYLQTRTAEATFSIPEDSLEKYEDYPDFIETYQELKSEQVVLATDLQNTSHTIEDLRSQNLAYLQKRSDFGRESARFENHKNTHAENIDRLQGQLNNPEVLANYIKTTSTQEPRPNNSQVAQFLIDNGVQAGPSLGRMVNAVNNLIDTEQAIAQQQLAMDEAQKQMEVEEAAFQQRTEAVIAENQKLVDTSQRLSDIYYKDLAAVERSQAEIDMKIELKNLMEVVDENGDGSLAGEMDLTQQVELLNLISGLESTADQFNVNERDEKGYRLQDAAGRYVEWVAGERFSNFARSLVENNTKRDIINMIEPEAIGEFLRHNSSQARSLLTDNMGHNRARIDFLGNHELETNVGLTDFLTPENQFVKVESYSSGDTLYGQRTVSPDGRPMYKNLVDGSEIIVDTNDIIQGYSAIPGEFNTDDFGDNVETEYDLLTQNKLEYDYNRNVAQARLANRIANQSIRNIYAHLGIDIGSEVNASHHEAFITVAREKFGNLSFFENFNQSYTQLQGKLEELNQQEPPLSAREMAIEVNNVYEKFGQEATQMVGESIKELRSSGSPDVQAQLAEINELISIFGTTTVDILNQQKTMVETRIEGLNRTLVNEYFPHLTPEQLVELNTFLALNRDTPPSKLDLSVFLVENLDLNAAEYGYQANGEVSPKFLQLYNDLGNYWNLQAESYAIETRAQQFRMQQFMQEMISDPNNELNQFLGLVRSNLSAEENALLDSIKAGEPIDFDSQKEALDQLILSIQNSSIPPEVGITLVNTYNLGRQRALGYLTGVQGSHNAARQAEEQQSRAAVTAENITDMGREMQQNPQILNLYRAAKRPDGSADQALLSIVNQENPDYSEANIQRLVSLSRDPSYQNASLEQQASMVARATNQAVSIEADAQTLSQQYNFYLPPGVSYGYLSIDPTGETQGTFTSADTDFIIDNDGTIIAEHLTGVPDAEDLRVPPQEWATAQALAAMTDGFVVKSAAELAQAGETLGNRALVNFMKQYWGIRGNNTLPESELDKFKSLGEMMSDNHINLHTVLSQLNAVKWDNTADGSRALNVRNQFNQILEAAAAGNNKGFRTLLNLDNLPPETPTA